MSKKLFNRDFSRGDRDYIFSFNLYVQHQKLDPQADYVSGMKQFDGWMVYPYDADDRLYGLGDLCGHIILPQWCYIDKPSKAAYSRKSRKHDRQQRRNRYPRPVRSTTV